MLEAMSRISESSVVSLIRGASIGWVAMIAVFASYMFLLPHGPHFAPEVGPVGSFMTFGTVYSIIYLVDFVLLAIPTYFLLYGRKPPLRRWHWALSGSVLFLLSLIVWCSAYGLRSSAELLFYAVLAAIAGAASFYALPSQHAVTISGCL